jgi:KipI family sensor histidine kinase inhibitor
MKMLFAGDAAVLVDLHTDAGGARAKAELAAQVLGLRAALEGSRPAGVIDLVPAEGTVLVTFDPRAIRPADVAQWIRGTPPRPPDDDAGTLVEIPVVYDGEDLAEVGRLTGLGADGVVAAHLEQTWTVAFTGFAPGFGYLVPHDPADTRLGVPRRPEPRVRVPAGAIALAAGYTGVYPRPSPGGWQLIGRTDAVVWDSAREPPALLRPGVRVRFVEFVESEGRGGGRR